LPVKRNKETAMALIAIAGATGSVGAKLTSQLLAAGARVRVLSRNPEKAKALFNNNPNCEVAGIDFDTPNSLRQALKGADRAFLCTGTSERQVRDEIALIDAAVQAGVPYLVSLSVGGAGSGSAANSTSNVLAWHTEIDAHLAAQDVASTLLRPATFTDTLIRVASKFVPKGAWGGTAEDGLISAIDTRDVAACAAAILLEGPECHAQKVYTLTGPAPVTMDGVAALLTESLSGPVRYVRRSADEQRAFYLASGFPPLMVEVLLGLDDLTRGNVFAEPTDEVLALTGRVPRSLAAFVRERVGDFVMGARL
jgi:NAD(P)H dehydrogenase (quinone)